MIHHHLFNVVKDVDVNLILIQLRNIKKYVKKYFKIKENNLMHNNKELLGKINLNL